MCISRKPESLSHHPDISNILACMPHFNQSAVTPEHFEFFFSAVCF
jgi:hypothetical protein